MDKQRVAIVGSGTAGSATALFLSRLGHEVTLFEKVDRPTAIGAGVMLQPSGMQVLQELGLEEEILQSGAIVERLHATTTKDKVVLDLRYKELDQKYYGVGLHRGVLFQTLYDSVQNQNITTETGAEICEIVQSDCGDCSLISGEGREFSTFDLVVIASGARTHLRKVVGIPHTVKEYPWGALWFVANSGTEDSSDVLRQYLDSTHTMLGFLPTGKEQHHQQKLTSLFWSIKADQVDHFRATGLSQWKAKVLDLAPHASHLLDQIQSIDQLLFAPYYDVVLRRPFQGNVIFLGDAAHATSPQLGQGCNLALVDAMTFANAMSQSNTIPAAFKLYAKRRRGQIRYYQWATRFLTPFFQSNSRALGWLRDLTMGISCRIPLISRLMISTMCGFQEGILKSSKKQ